MLENFPGLQAKDLVNAWEYVKAHPDEIDRQIAENKEKEDQEDIEATREAAPRTRTGRHNPVGASQKRIGALKPIPLK